MAIGADEAEILARWAGIEIPEPCREGVLANLAILARHMEVVRRAAAEAPADPAELLRP